jgi:alkanesulfonate monooxygenase SsuD/methylene tetrahydromethanopterin reductase-like flavin-dependent oxidoreductase (luciferase family)
MNDLLTSPATMAVGVGLPVRSWPANRSWSYSEIADYAVRADRLGFDSVWAIDHFPVEGFNSELETLAGPDPLTLLSYIAARTSQVHLGTMVACPAFRNPGQLVREAKALAELSGGRFVLALGSGSRLPEIAANNLATDHLVSRFAEYLEVVDRLLLGEVVHYSGRYIQLHGAQVLGGGMPTLWLAGSGPRSIGLVARYASGWAGARDSFAEQLATLRAAERAEGRPEGSVVASRRAQALFMRPEEWELIKAGDPELSEYVVVGTPDDLVELADQYRLEGCRHMILHFAGARWSNYAVEQMEMAASVLPRMRGGPRAEGR